MYLNFHLKPFVRGHCIFNHSPFQFPHVFWLSLENVLHKWAMHFMSHAHSNHVTSSKREDTLICHTTMRGNPINFLYNPGHVTLWCVKVGLVANPREGSTQEHNWAMVCRMYSVCQLGTTYRAHSLPNIHVTLIHWLCTLVVVSVVRRIKCHCLNQ